MNKTQPSINRLETSGKLFKFLMCAIVCLALAGLLVAQDSIDIKTHYEKHEYQIPMRDGVKLFTSVYIPRETTQEYPILLTRTPYSVAPYGPDEYSARISSRSPRYAKEGYIFVFQDVRGRYMSEGEFVHMTPHKTVKHGPADVDESSDTYDTIDWLIKNVPRNNGRVGIIGGSYPGFFTVAGIIDAHPALRAASPQCPQTDWFIGDDTHHNGAFFLTSTFNFMASNGRRRPAPTTERGQRFRFGTPDGYQFFLEMGPLSNADAKYFHGEVPGWTIFMEHGTYDKFWQLRNILPHLQNIRPATLNVGGWYDANNLYGALNAYKAIEKQSPETTNILVMGPWSHGQWGRGDGDALGPLRFGSKTALFFRENIEFPFFEYYLKGKGDPKLPDAYIFETGRNQWRTFDAWPPKDIKTLSIYLREGGAISFDPPEKVLADTFDEYVSDPDRPVPFVAGVTTRMDSDYMVHDQRFTATRPDVLVYQSNILTENLTVAGPITPSLFVSTTGTDSDWIVKLIDVIPNDTPDNPPDPSRPGSGEVRMGGFQYMVRGDVIRGKFRNSFEKPEPFTPGKITQVEFTMTDILHTFLKGHRIMVQIQSTWFPLVDRNPQKFVDIYHASATDFQKATQKVYRSTKYPSHIILRVRKN